MHEVHVPLWKEFSTKVIFAHYKKKEKFGTYLPDEKGKFPVDRPFLFKVLNTIDDGLIPRLVNEQKKKRMDHYLTPKDEEFDDSILITADYWKKIEEYVKTVNLFSTS